MRGVVGIFAVDPGTTTGIDYGYWRLNCPVKEAVEEWDGFLGELTGHLEDQCVKICEMYEQFLGLNSKVNRHLVVESYTQRPTAHFVQPEALDPVRLAYMVVGRLSARFEPSLRVVNWQSASNAMAYATDARLREWGAWARGMPHARDARRHALAFRSALSR